MLVIDENAQLTHSLNLEIKPEHKRVIYATFLQLCKLQKCISKKGWIQVIDAIDAYYCIPILKQYYHLFRVIWLNSLLIFKYLSFGLSTSN